MDSIDSPMSASISGFSRHAISLKRCSIAAFIFNSTILMLARVLFALLETFANWNPSYQPLILKYELFIGAYQSELRQNFSTI